MKTITQIRVWKSDKGEIRIYLTFEGCKEQGCYYKDGNAYQPKGTLQGMTEEDKQNAIALCEKAIGKRAWVTLYPNQIENLNKYSKTTAPVQKAKTEIKPAEMSKEKVTQIRVWKSDKGEIRIYLTFEGCKEQGCYYKDGNAYQPKGTLQGMTEEDKQNAIALCEKAIGKRAWVTLYPNQIENLNKYGKTTAPVQKAKTEIKPAEMSKEEIKKFHQQMSQMEDAETFGYREKVNYTQRPSIEEDYA